MLVAERRYFSESMTKIGQPEPPVINAPTAVGRSRPGRGSGSPPGAGLQRGASCQSQHPDAFDEAAAVLGCPACTAVDGRARSGFGIGTVGLAASATPLAVRSVHLDHGHAFAGQEPGQAGPIGAGAVDADAVRLAEAAAPAQQLLEARPSRPIRRRRVSRAREAAVRLRILAGAPRQPAGEAAVESRSDRCSPLGPTHPRAHRAPIG